MSSISLARRHTLPVALLLALPTFSAACTQPTGDDDARTAESAATTTITLLASTSIAKGASKTGVYTSTVAGTITFKTSGTGDADLYVKKGAAASPSLHDCASEGSTAVESCAITVAVGDKIYWDVYGYAASTASLVVVLPDALPPPATTTVTLFATTSLAKGASKNGSYTATAAGSITFKTSGTGDADLFVKKGSSASRTVYDCKSDGSTATETCAVTVAVGDVVYYSVYAYTAASVGLVVVVPVASGDGGDTSVALPPGYQYCTTATLCGTTIPRANACAPGSTSCAPTRTTTVEWTVNGAPVSTVGFNLRTVAATPVVVSGPASIFAAQFLAANNAPRMVLGSSLDVTLSYYDVAPVWGGTTRLGFTGTSATTAHGASSLFKFATYDIALTHATLAARIEQIATDEIAIAQVTPPPYRAFFLPTEMAVVLGVEGNFSWGDGTVAINYGNPDWIVANGGVLAIAAHEFSHEHTHTLFAQIASKFTGNPTCFNEGLADALGNYLGYVPDSDFGVAQDGTDFALGCTQQTEIHAKGNCVLWRLKQAGYFTRAMFTALFAPKHTYAFDSCSETSPMTANTYVVYLTEATGTDMSAFVTSIGMANAGSYAAAKTALGF